MISNKKLLLFGIAFVFLGVLIICSIYYLQNQKYSYEEVQSKLESNGIEITVEQLKSYCNHELEEYKVICTLDKEKVDNELKVIKQYDDIGKHASSISQEIVDTVVDETGKMGGN